MKKIVSKALIIDSSGLLLLLYRGATHPNFPGHLDLPGGEVEPGEPYEQATSREILEETGLSIPPTHLNQAFVEENDNTIHVLFTAELPQNSPAVETSWEHKGYIWISQSDLLDTHMPENADPYYVEVINYLKSLV